MYVCMYATYTCIYIYNSMHIRTYLYMYTFVHFSLRLEEVSVASGCIRGIYTSAPVTNKCVWGNHSQDFEATDDL